MIAAQAFQRAMRRSARAHIVLGMDFEEAALRAFGENCCQVLVLEARPGDAADGQAKSGGGWSQTPEA